MADPGYIVDGVLTDGEAWVGLNTSTLGSDAATVTFKSGFADGDDPAGSGSGGVQNWDQYMDLVLIYYVQSTYVGAAGVSLYSEFNGDSANNSSWQRITASGTTVTPQYVASTRSYAGILAGVGFGANVFSAAVCQIFDINSGKYKSQIAEVSYDSAAVAGGGLQIISSTWKSQDAISEIELVPSTASIAAGSTFSLFGVLPRMVA